MQDTTQTQQNVPLDNVQTLLSVNTRNGELSSSQQITDVKTPGNSPVEEISKVVASVPPEKLPRETPLRKDNYLSAFLRNKQNDNENTADQGKKTLPPHIRDHFEANSSAFVAFAQKKDISESEKITGPTGVDEWDKALLFGEYPNGKAPIDILAPSENTSSLVPKKPPAPTQQNILPTQVFSEIPSSSTQKYSPRQNSPINIHPISSSLPHPAIKEVLNVASQETRDEKRKTIILPRFVSRKPAGAQTENERGIVATKNHITINGAIIPQKPVTMIDPINLQSNSNTMQTPIENTTKDSSSLAPPEPGMGELLQKKIIDGQMRTIFEDAPAGTRENLEKMLARDILSVKDMAEKEQDPNNVWKRRLRDYIIKLKWQGKTAFEKTEETDPIDGETVVSYVQRIYPSVIKVEMKEK